jgi:hypothetical protein
MHELSLKIHPDAPSTIKRVRCCSNPDTVAIRLIQSQETDSIINWNLEKDVQMDAFDVLADAMTFQDKSG